MSDSSYSDIERGINTPGTLTAVLLLNMQDDPNFFLNTVNEKFQEWYEREMTTV